MAWLVNPLFCNPDDILGDQCIRINEVWLYLYFDSYLVAKIIKEAKWTTKKRIGKLQMILDIFKNKLGVLLEISWNSAP